MQICSLSANVNNNLFQTRTIKVVVFIRTQWLACEVRLMRNNSFYNLKNAVITSSSQLTVA